MPCQSCQKSRQENPSQTSFECLLFGDEEGITSGNVLREARLPPLPQVAEFLPVFAVKLIRTDHVRLDGRPHIRSPLDAAALAWKHLQFCDREQVMSLLLDTKGRVIGLNVVSVGDLSSAIIHPREVFKAAILANAASIILTHNHPSGDPTPSPDDVAVSRRIAEGGELLGIELLDHVVIGDTAARFVSLKERGLL